MALNGFFENNKSIIGRFLSEGKTVYVLMASPESVRQNTLLYHGVSLDETELMKNMNDLLNKQVDTLNCIERIPGIFDYFKNGKFKLRTLDTVFSTSFVAYDIFEKEILGNGTKKGKELKASFYQYRCIEPQNEPNIVVDSFSSRDWYLFFKDTIKLQWNDGNIIAGREEFEELRDTMNEMLQSNRDIQKKKKNVSENQPSI